MKDPNVKFHYINPNAPKLSEQEAEQLDQEITETEVAQALKEMARNKTPGPDGWTADFYKFF